MCEPGIIRKLSEEVVNRIAAGEIVQRPANALKELIENSLDAKSTNIIITVKAGGLKYLQIQDNGSGIRHEDLEIVCERFTTSKLQQYEDLREINTYGFRGEALASISHIAHLTILTKTANGKCAYKATYENGHLKGPIKACAGNNGTQITVEDLFYNIMARKKALRSPTEEYAHIMEVVGGYAIHNSHVGFTLKKFGENTDLKTPIRSSVVDNVRIIHGNAIARELMEIKLEDPLLKLVLFGYVTNVNYSHKKGAMLLFINHRLVDSQAIKKSVESVYATYLPKNAHPFVYLSLELDPKNVDVNVHPTKHEVQFLYEEQIIEKIKSCIESKLLSCNSTRVMYTQARLPGATAVEEIVKKTTDGAKIYANNMVRVNPDIQKIDKFFPTVTKDTETHNSENVQNMVQDTDLFEEDELDNDTETVVPNISLKKDFSDTNNKNRITPPNIVMVEADNEILESSLINEPKEIINKMPDRWKAHTAADQANATYIDPKESFKTRTFKYERIETKLTSVKQLRLDIENKCNMNLREILANLIFIACIDCHKSLIQHSTKLYLCDTTRLSEELFYETLLYDFQNFGLIKMSNPLPLEELLVLGLSSQEEEWNPELEQAIDLETLQMLSETDIKELVPVIGHRAKLNTQIKMLRAMSGENSSSTIMEICEDSLCSEQCGTLNTYILQSLAPSEQQSADLIEPVKENITPDTSCCVPNKRRASVLGDMREMARQMTELLLSKKAMLYEYFSLEMNANGELLSLPLLLDGHTPFMGALPTYLVRLVTEVNWESEKECFDNFARQTAIFYSQPNPDTANEAQKSEYWKQEHIIFPAIRRNFLPPTNFVNNGAILQIANLNDLYKVFERC